MKGETTGDSMQYAARLVVKDLDKQIEFYTETIGLMLQWRKGNEAGLGGCSFNILLLAKGDSTASNEDVTIKLPSRRELAIVIGRLCTVKYSNQAKDHGSRHSTHLTDPEGNAVEIAVEIPGVASHAPTVLDKEALFNELDPDDRLCDKMSDKATISKHLATK